MTHEKGSLSIHSENIFPIIKKWLYSDHDIFIRELISNACDAITKVKQLSSLGEADLKDDRDFKVTVILDKAANTLTFKDNGIGMTDEEIKKYINQIAFSGAEDFLAQYKDKADKDQIIGHFGLGFYSSFMVAETVDIHTLSFKDGAAPVLWHCDGGTEFEMEDGSRSTRGTDIVLHLGEDGKEFSNEHTIRSTIEKYCSFMPYPIYFEVAQTEEEKAEAEAKKVKAAEESLSDETLLEDAVDDAAEMEPAKPIPLNDSEPLYTKQPSACSDEDYKAFYRNTFHDYKEPLFWIHLNMDYPFNLKGILYFPKLNTEFDTIEGRIKLYNNQVFVADNVKEVIPEFLLLLKGVIDCPDLPLNVSRSFLQNDGFVKKISDYISKKVADKLTGLFKTDRENFEKFWDDIHPFVKYGSLKDEKFHEKVEGSYLFKTVKGNFVTIEEYLEAHKDVLENTVYYATNRVQQAHYIDILSSHDVDVMLLEHNIDPPFISLMESKKDKLAFKRVDADVSDLMKDKESAVSEETLTEESTQLLDLFKGILSKEHLKVKVESLKNEEVSGMVVLAENNRRMQDMMKAYGMQGLDPSMFPSEEELILNRNHPLVQYMLTHLHDDSELKSLIVKQVYDLAIMGHKPLTADEMTAFIKRSNDIMKRMVSN